MTAPFEPVFSTHREGELTLDDHEAITAMLARAFPDYDHWFDGARSWSGMQPEVRVVAKSGDVVVAHAGIRRMFVQAGSTDHLIGAVGLVAVSPILQGTGLGRQLLGRVEEVLRDLHVPFGLLGAGEGAQGFYRRHGWQPLERTTVTSNALSADGAATLVTDDDGWLLLPIEAPRSAWPAGEIAWNGQQV